MQSLSHHGRWSGRGRLCLKKRNEGEATLIQLESFPHRHQAILPRVRRNNCFDSVAPKSVEPLDHIRRNIVKDT